MKWEPVAAMALVILLGLWLVWGGSTRLGLPEWRDHARLLELRLGNERGALEIVRDPAAPDSPTYRFLFRDGSSTAVMSAEELARVLPPEVFNRVVAEESNSLYRLLNITNRGSLAWIMIGLAGQVVFSCRFLVQWLVSEKQRKSTIPPVFWWLSLGGGICLFAYFAWRQDIVGVLGQSSGLVIYSRNIRLLHKQRKREQRRMEAAATASSATAPAPSAPVTAAPPGESDPPPSAGKSKSENPSEPRPIEPT